MGNQKNRHTKIKLALGHWDHEYSVGFMVQAESAHMVGGSEAQFNFHKLAYRLPREQRN